MGKMHSADVLGKQIISSKRVGYTCAERNEGFSTAYYFECL